MSFTQTTVRPFKASIMNHILLLHKQKHSYQILDKALDWIRSYLFGREQGVVVQGKCSQWVEVRSGTPEGGLISLLLFACFVDDLPGVIETEALMFADDVKVYRRVDSETDVNFIQAAAGQPVRVVRQVEAGAESKQM